MGEDCKRCAEITEGWHNLRKDFFAIIKKFQCEDKDITIPKDVLDAYISKWYAGCGNCGDRASKKLKELLKEK